jgi:transaldolase
MACAGSRQSEHLLTNPSAPPLSSYCIRRASAALRTTRDTAATLAEARRLWQTVSRPNLMIKVVATPEGVKAVDTLISEGININIKLMFSMRHYEAVSSAYIRGLERCRQPEKIASVASFFVSRVDIQVDKALEANGSGEALALRGRIAIANAKLVYPSFP